MGEWLRREGRAMNEERENVKISDGVS